MARLVSAASVALLGVAAALAQRLLPLAQSRFKPVFAWKNRRSSKKTAPRHVAKSGRRFWFMTRRVLVYRRASPCFGLTESPGFAWFWFSV